MARTRAQTRADQNRRSPSASYRQGKQPQNGVRKRNRQTTSHPRQQQTELRRSSRSPISSSPKLTPTATAQTSPTEPPFETQTPPSSGGRKRSRERQDTLEPPSEERPAKRPRPSACANQLENDEGEIDPIEHWAREGRWPRQYSEQDPDMERLLARKKSSSSLSRKRSGSGSAGSVTPSDQKPREEKSAPYRDPRYKTLLATKGSFMEESALGIADESKDTYTALLSSQQSTPNNSLFRDDLFKKTCRKVEDRNEARVMRDITPLIVPSAETLTTYGASELDCLIESTNEGWNNSIPLTGTRPQPDYSVGFRREAFTTDQLDKLSPFIGDFIAGDLSFFMATYMMYFPFLTCEVKCGAAALDIADRQNAHSMTLAVRAIVELFRLVKREDELNHQILAFAVSHDHCSVRIYGHYPVIDGKDTKYYRYPIHKFDFTAMEGRDKWTAYRFTRNVYDVWMPAHFKKICSAIDQLPSHLNFDVPSLPETGLSQKLESHQLSQSDVDSTPPSQEHDRQSGITNQQDVTPDTSFNGSAAAKRLRRRHGTG